MYDCCDVEKLFSRDIRSVDTSDKFSSFRTITQKCFEQFSSNFSELFISIDLSSFSIPSYEILFIKRGIFQFSDNNSKVLSAVFLKLW